VCLRFHHIRRGFNPIFIHNESNSHVDSRGVLQEDSILLWKTIVSSPLLKQTSLILFLNKCDILKVSDIVMTRGVSRSPSVSMALDLSGSGGWKHPDSSD
jgi:hypothetical protein